MTSPTSKTPVLQSLPYTLSAQQWFEKLRTLAMPVLLSSGDSGHPAARYDIISAGPAKILRSAAGHTCVTDTASGKVIDESGSPFTVLSRHCPVNPDLRHVSLPFTGGAIGYFAYELLHEKNAVDDSDKAGKIALPDMLVGIYQWAIIIDHEEQSSWLVMRDLSAEQQQEIRTLLEQDSPPSDATSFQLKRPFRSNFSKQEYLERFRRVIDYIHAGDCYQVNLAQCFSADCEGDSWQAFRKLQGHANAPFSAYIEDGEQAVLSFSPERFIGVTDCQVITQPIKGTRPRSPDPVQDLANKTDLETSNKDRAENLMIVDLLRNDIGRVCSFGSVSVENLFETQSFTNVHHLVSTITGELQQPQDVFKLMEACFPGGSITGTPKLRSMEIINELETMPRSVYCGAIAWVDFSGNMDSNITIRTLVRDQQQIHCWGGGGVVADSDGDEEYQETLDKISILINNL